MQNFHDSLWRKILCEVSCLLVVCGLAAYLLSGTIWSAQTVLLHTLLELVCIFIAIMAFITLWNSKSEIEEGVVVIGFGFLVVAIFDAWHTLYHPSLGTYPAGFFDLGTWYWMLGRATEALTLFIVSFAVVRIKRTRTNLLLTLALPTLICAWVYYNRSLLPVLLTAQGLTPVKIIMEWMVILCFLAVLPRLARRMENESLLSYRYIVIAVILAIPAEICFTVFHAISSFWNVLGHLLKAACYYSIFRGVVVSALVFPYTRIVQAHNYFDEVLNNLPMGILTFSRMNQLNFANRSALIYLNCDYNNIKGLSDTEMAAIMNFPDDIVRSNLSRDYQERLLTTHDQTSPNLAVTTYSLSSGETVYLMTPAREEQDLSNIRLQTRTVLDKINNLVIITDGLGRIIMGNKLVEQVGGIKEAEVLGLSLNELTRYDQVLETRKLDSRPEKSDSWYVYLQTDQLPVREIHVSRSHIHNMDGEYMGSIYVGTDITAIHEQQSRLEQQEKLAAVGQMAAGVVHEIKNPLTTIKGFSQILTMGGLDENDIQEYASIIQETTQQMNQMVTDFLAYARPRSPERKPVLLNELIQSIGQMMDGHLFMNSSTLQYHLFEPDEPVLIDPDQIRQVLLNLIKNAIEATQNKHGALVTVTTRVEDGAVKVIIADNGTGIDPDDLSKLGTPFYTTKDKGTGLGLSICYQLVKKNCGTLSVQSLSGQGTVFTLSFTAIGASDKVS